MSIPLTNAPTRGPMTRHDLLVEQAAKRIPHPNDPTLSTAPSPPPPPPPPSPKKRERHPIASNDDFVIPTEKTKKPTPKVPTPPAPTESKPPKKQPSPVHQTVLGGGVSTGNDPFSGVMPHKKHKKRGHK